MRYAGEKKKKEKIKGKKEREKRKRKKKKTKRKKSGKKHGGGVRSHHPSGGFCSSARRHIDVTDTIDKISRQARDSYKGKNIGRWVVCTPNPRDVLFITFCSLFGKNKMGKIDPCRKNPNRMIEKYHQRCCGDVRTAFGEPRSEHRRDL